MLHEFGARVSPRSMPRGSPGNDAMPPSVHSRSNAGCRSPAAAGGAPIAGASIPAPLPTSGADARYTSTAIVLHWLIAALVIAQFGWGWWMQEIPKLSGGTARRRIQPPQVGRHDDPRADGDPDRVATRVIARRRCRPCLHGSDGCARHPRRVVRGCWSSTRSPDTSAPNSAATRSSFSGLRCRAGPGRTSR